MFSVFMLLVRIVLEERVRNIGFVRSYRYQVRLRILTWSRYYTNTLLD